MVYIAEVKVYVWLGREALEFGHASMNIKDVDGSCTYVSFYPATTHKKEIQHLWKSSSGSTIDKHDEDCYKMERKPDQIICIPNLPNPNNHSTTFYKNHWQTSSWKLIGTNCCHVVINNLQWMSEIPFNSSHQSWHPAWSPQDVIHYANTLRSQDFAKPLTIKGVGYTINNSTVEIRADKLINNRKGGKSGALMLKLWATTSPDDIANINDNGHVFAETQFDKLAGGWNYLNIKHPVTYRRPPAGTYYVVATLHEDEGNSEWPIYDWVSVDGQITSKALIIEGTVGYTISGSKVEITACKLINNRKGGKSGTLMLKLWATTSPSGIVNINDNGHVFAETQFDPLEARYHYPPNIKHTVTYDRPPAGTYYVVATLHEYEGNIEWPIRDWVSVDGQIISKALIIEGNVGYTIKDTYVHISIDKLVNNRKSGESGTLMLRLWATTSPSKIPNIKNSHVFAKTRFDELKGGKYHPKQTLNVTYDRPLAGTYYVMATLHECENADGEEDNWPIHDWVSVDKHLTV